MKATLRPADIGVAPAVAACVDAAYRNYIDRRVGDGYSRMLLRKALG